MRNIVLFRAFIVSLNNDLIESLTPKDKQAIDGMFAGVINEVAEQNKNNASPKNAKKTKKNAMSQLKSIESTISRITKSSIKSKQTALYNEFNAQLNKYQQFFTMVIILSIYQDQLLISLKKLWYLPKSMD